MGDGPEITSPSDKETKLDNLKPLIRVIDDDYAMRRSWAFLIEGEGWEVVTYSNALAFLAANDFSRPGCLLLDVRMPRMSGLELQNALKDKGVDLPIIFISGHGDIDMAVRGLKSGAVDFLQKPVDDRKLLESLTQREREVIRMVAQGASNKAVAEGLGISEKTVQVHRGSAYRKLEIHNAAEIARLLMRCGDPL